MKREINWKIIEEEFDKGCSVDNISDPPSDRRWIKNFLHQTILSILDEAIGEEGIKWMQEGSKKDRKGFTDGFNTKRSEIIELQERLK